SHGGAGGGGRRRLGRVLRGDARYGAARRSRDRARSGRSAHRGREARARGGRASRRRGGLRRAALRAPTGRLRPRARVRARPLVACGAPRMEPASPVGPPVMDMAARVARVWLPGVPPVPRVRRGHPRQGAARHMVGSPTRIALAEAIGTFTLVFAGVLAINAATLAREPEPTSLIAVAFAHGLAILVMVAALAAISGGHFNPAITLGFVV